MLTTRFSTSQRTNTEFLITNNRAPYLDLSATYFVRTRMNYTISWLVTKDCSNCKKNWPANLNKSRRDQQILSSNASKQGMYTRGRFEQELCKGRAHINVQLCAPNLTKVSEVQKPQTRQGISPYSYLISEYPLHGSLLAG